MDQSESPSVDAISKSLLEQSAAQAEQLSTGPELGQLLAPNREQDLKLRIADKMAILEKQTTEKLNALCRERLMQNKTQQDGSKAADS